MSRSDLYYSVAHLSGKKTEDVREDELYYDSCMVFRFIGEKFRGEGFNSITKDFSMKPINGLEKYEVFAEGEQLTLH